MVIINMMYHHLIYLYPRKQRMTEMLFLLFLFILFLYIGSNHFEFSTLDKNLSYYKATYLGICLEFAKIISVIYSIFIIFTSYQNDKNRFFILMISKRNQQLMFFATKRLMILLTQITSILHIYLVLYLVPSLFLPYKFTISAISNDILLTMFQVIFMSLLSEIFMKFINHLITMLPLILSYWYIELMVEDSSQTYNNILLSIKELMPLYTTDFTCENSVIYYLLLDIIFLFVTTILWSKKEYN